MDRVYDSMGEEPLSPFVRGELALHLFFCPRCAGELRKLEEAETLMRTGFFPPAPAIEESLMDRILEEEGREEVFDAPTGVSFRGWVITGFVVLISLSSSFFGMNFTVVADAQGPSFLLPLGITIGAVLTGYGALFIGSHLKELSARFRLH
jgi:hypothetical protein